MKVLQPVSVGCMARTRTLEGYMCEAGRVYASVRDLGSGRTLLWGPLADTRFPNPHTKCQFLYTLGFQVQQARPRLRR